MPAMPTSTAAVGATQAGQGVLGASTAVSAGSYSELSVSVETRVESFMAQQSSSANEQMLQALVLLLILMQIMGVDFDEEGQKTLAGLAALYGQMGKTGMASASYQAISMTQSISMTSTSSTAVSAQAVGGAAAATGGSIDVVA